MCKYCGEPIPSNRGRWPNSRIVFCSFKCKRLQGMKRFKEKNRILIMEYKNRPCLDCGESYPSYVMDFDHREPSEKLFQLGGTMTRNTGAIMREIAKCDVVCANCHRIRTHGRGGNP